MKHPKCFRKCLELWIVCLLGIVRADLADFMSGSQSLFDGVSLIHDPSRGWFEVQQIQESARQDDNQGIRNIGRSRSVVSRHHQGTARDNSDYNGSRGEYEIRGEKFGLKTAKRMSRKGFEHDNPSNETDPYTASKPRRECKKMKQHGSVTTHTDTAVTI